MRGARCWLSAYYALQICIRERLGNGSLEGATLNRVGVRAARHWTNACFALPNISDRKADRLPNERLERTLNRVGLKGARHRLDACPALQGMSEREAAHQKHERYYHQ